MRVVTLGLALAVLLARPAGAGRMLYATAATPNRIDGFCLREGGGMAPRPSIRRETAGRAPRRLLVVDDRLLYVAESDRVEVFVILPGGGLDKIGATPRRSRSGPRDVAVSLNRTMLYVPDRARSRVVGHPLDANGVPQPFNTCIQADIGAGVENVTATVDKLYLSESGGAGRIRVFGIAADGRLVGADGPTTEAACTTPKGGTRPDPTPPLSERRRIAGIKSFVIVGNLLYAEDRGRRRIRAFELMPDGNFPPPTIENPNKPNKKTWAPPVFKTKPFVQYEHIFLDGTTLIGTQSFNGRIDTYALGTDGALPSKPTNRSRDDLRLTPVRLTTADGIVYVAAGEFDRIVAYKLRPNGRLVDDEPFSQTEEQEDSFPNDVAIAMLTEGCP